MYWSLKMGYVRRLKGKDAAKAATQAGDIQQQAAGEASALFDPLGFGAGGVDQSALDNLDSQIASLNERISSGGGGGALGRLVNQSGVLGEQLSELTQERDRIAGINNPAGLGQQGLAQAGFLTDPQAQFDFLQSNPLFQSALDNANQQTLQSSAARGRLSSGDTLQQLSQNTLLAASPLIQQQKQSIGNLLTIGQNATGNQANLLTSGSAAQAAGVVGAANAKAQGASNLLAFGGQLLGAGIGAI